MRTEDLVKQLLAGLAVAGGEGIGALLEGATLDEAFARTLESLSDRRAQARNFPDGRYIPE